MNCIRNKLLRVTHHVLRGPLRMEVAVSPGFAVASAQMFLHPVPNALNIPPFRKVNDRVSHPYIFFMLGIEVSNRRCEFELGYDVMKEKIIFLYHYERVLF